MLEIKNNINEYFNKGYSKGKCYYISIRSDYLINRLKQINAYGNKDNRNPFKFIPENNRWSFVKGLFDGDGNFYKGTFSIAGRKEIIKEVYYWICEKINKEPNKVYQTTSSDKTFYFQINGKDTKIVLDRIFKNSYDDFNSKKIRRAYSYFK